MARSVERARVRTPWLELLSYYLEVTHTSTENGAVLSGATLSGIYKKQKKHGQQQLGPLALDI